MVRFPETAAAEWEAVAVAADAEVRLRQRIERDTKIEGEAERMRVRHEAQIIFQQELDEADTPDLEMGTLAAYKANPAGSPTDLIEGVVKDNGLTVMLGPSTSGKSTLALQMLYCLLTGEDFLGQESTQINGAVGAVSYDMEASLMLDWMSGFPNVDPKRVSVVNAHKRGNPLNVPALRAKIVDAWQRAKVEVVVIDSFSASFFGHDQNDAGATMEHYRNLGRFALTEVGARACIIITHSTESNPHKARGSSVHHDVADTIVSVAADRVGSRTVRMVKYRQHRDAVSGKMTHQMNPVVITAPDNVTHLVDVDPGGMTLAGLPLPKKYQAAAFTSLPPEHELPDTSSDNETEVGDDDL